MTKREPLQSEAYFDEFISFKNAVINRDQQALLNDPTQFARPDALASFVFNHQRALFIAEYSRGYPVENMHAAFIKIIESFGQLKDLDPENTFALTFKTDMDDYVRALWLVSQAALLDIAPDMLHRMLCCIGNEGQDLLFEQLVAALVPGVSRKPAKKLLYPKAYQPLYDAVMAPAEQQDAFVHFFLQNWYKQMRNTAWHGNHKLVDGGFFGYWCWEAAGVAVAFGIDDARFRNLPYYPKDLADFARSRVSG